MTITVKTRGYYDTLTEHVCLIREGSKLQVSNYQPPAPCRSKVGLWVDNAFCINSNRTFTAFIEDGNYSE